jgi:hypothetical protein
MALGYGAFALSSIGVGYLTFIGLKFFERKRTIKLAKS